MLIIRARINTKTKNAQVFLFNYIKKIQNFVSFVNYKQKTKTHLNGN